MQVSTKLKIVTMVFTDSIYNTSYALVIMLTISHCWYSVYLYQITHCFPLHQSVSNTSCTIFTIFILKNFPIILELFSLCFEVPIIPEIIPAYFACLYCMISKPHYSKSCSKHSEVTPVKRLKIKHVCVLATRVTRNSAYLFNMETNQYL